MAVTSAPGGKLSDDSGERGLRRGAQALVAIRAAGSKPPLFCVHASSGHLRLYHGLASHLDPDRPVYGLRRMLGSDPHRFEEMAEDYVREIRQLGRSGPYLIFGECDGGELTLEVARQLAGAGDDVALLVLVDSVGPGLARDWRPSHPAYRALDSIWMLGAHARILARIDARARRDYVTSRLSRILARLREILSRRRGAAESAEVATRRTFGEALAAYQARPYAGRVALFRGSRLPWGVKAPRHLGWGSLVPDLDVVTIPGYYGTTMMEPTVGLLAEKLERTLDAAAGG